jgi:hypothetical protein
MRTLIILSAALALSACSETQVLDTPPPSGTGGSGGGPLVCKGAPAAPATSWCARMPMGSPGAGNAALELSAAHALARFFGVAPNYRKADDALVAALEPPATPSAPDLAAYVAALPNAVCVASAPARTLGNASVELVAGVAWVKPGKGAVTYPAGTQAVVVDLRGLSIDADWAMLTAAVSPALAAEVARPASRLRRHDGMVDEVFSATNVYKNSVATLNAAPIPPSGKTDLPLALLTEAVMPPNAVELAIALRVANRASILGEDVRVEVAEARWQPIGTSGLAVRFRDLGSPRLPDVIPADVRESEPACLVHAPADVHAPTPFAAGPATRPQVLVVKPFGAMDASDLTLGKARAGLVIAHGAARRFFGYPKDAGDVDGRLTETLASLDALKPLDRLGHWRILRRLGHALNDGHNFVFNYGGPATVGYTVVMIEDVDGEPVVRRSAQNGILPGDTIVSAGGVSTKDFYAAELARTSAASEGYRHDIATRYLTRLYGPTEFGLRAPDGTMKKVMVDPQPLAAIEAFQIVASPRTAGPLGDLGAPTLYYINAHQSVLTAADVTNVLNAAQNYAGLVLDMRGYPGIDHYGLARRLIQKNFSSPLFLVPQAIGPDQSSIQASHIDLTPLDTPAYTGPIVLLVGHHTVSAAENFSTMLVDAGRVKVVGRSSAATNGNITGVQLPANYAFTFTGMEVQHADGAKYNGVGIVPEIPVTLTAKAFAAGEDPELLAAVALLKK